MLQIIVNVHIVSKSADYVTLNFIDRYHFKLIISTDGVIDVRSEPCFDIVVMSKDSSS